MSLAPPGNRHIIVSDGRHRPDVYIDDPDGLIWLGDWSTLDAAKSQYPTALVLPAVWDAPIIDPADPSTHPRHPDDNQADEEAANFWRD